MIIDKDIEPLLALALTMLFMIMMFFTMHDFASSGQHAFDPDGAFVSEVDSFPCCQVELDLIAHLFSWLFIGTLCVWTYHIG